MTTVGSTAPAPRGQDARRPRRTLAVREASPTLARSLAIVCRNLVREPSSLLAIDRFQLVRTLGRGGNGVVYEAFDPLRRETVALKVLYEHGPSYLYRLKREFRALAELRHPNLVALHELSVGPDDAHFTMELIDGCDLLSYASHAVLHAPAPESRIRDALAQLTEGVHALHLAGKLHRDLKPSNVLVTAAGRVVLLDFGLVGEAGAAVSEPEGTPAFMAPEQARGAACEASDWYSIGCVLRCVLDAADAQARAGGDPRALAELDALAPLAARLMSPDPGERPGFAEVAACVHPSVRTPALRPETSAPPSAPWSASRRFVAREAELRALSDALARSRKLPVFVLLRGDSGIGKSALIERFASIAGERAWVLPGRCHQRESVPYKALDTTIDELSRLLLALPADHAARRTTRDDAALLALFPVLGRVPWLCAEPGALRDVHPVEQRSRGFAALRALLAQLAAERPLVLCIDDLQWSDADSGRLLGALLCEEDSPRLLVVASDRLDARTTNLALDELQRVAALSPRPVDVEELVLGALDPAHGAQLARVLPADVPQVQGSERIVLELVSAAGRPLSTQVVVIATGLGAECHAAIRRLRAGGLLRTVLRGADEWLELEHDRIGEAVLQRIDAVARVELHARLVRALLAQPEAARERVCEALTEQYIGAGMPLAAAGCARHAADAALSALAFTRAARLYEQALALGAWSAEEHAAIARDHARALEHAGRGVEAAGAYQQAAAFGSDPLVIASLEQRAADLLLRNGHVREGEALLQRGYRRLGLPWPEGRLALACAILRHARPSWLRTRRRADARGAALHRARASFLAHAGRGIEYHDLLRALHNALLCFDEGERSCDPIWNARVAGARGMMRCMAVWPGGATRGLAELERACRAVDALGDVPAAADLYRQLAVTHYAGGRPRAALEAANRSEACLRQLPDTSIDLNAVVSMIGTALFDLGRLREASQRWHALTYAARVHGDLMTTVWVHAQPIQLAVLFATEERERVTAILERVGRVRSEHPRYPLIGWVHAAGMVEHALHWGEAGDALRVVERERRALFGTHLAMFNAKARLVRARACLDAACAAPAGTRRSALLRRAAFDAALLRRERGAYHRGIALLLAAGVAVLRAQPRRAQQRLGRAAAAFDQSEAKLFAAAARYCQGTLLGGEAGSALQTPALAAFREEGVVDPRRYIAWMASGFRTELSIP